MNITTLCNSIEPFCTTYSAFGACAVVSFGLIGASIIVIGKTVPIAIHFAIKHNTLPLLKIIGDLFTITGNSPLTLAIKMASTYAMLVTGKKKII